MKQFKKTESCLYMLLYFLEHNKFDRIELMNILGITELDYYRYRNEVINTLYDFGYYNLIEKYEMNKK